MDIQFPCKLKKNNKIQALHDAIWHDHYDAAEAIISGGARTDLIAWDGLSVYSEAEKYWYSDILEIVNGVISLSHFRYKNRNNRFIKRYVVLW